MTDLPARPALADASLPSGLRPGGRFHEWSPAAPGFLVVDIDGTLLADGPVAAPAVVAAMSGCAGAGLPVGVATGRMPAATVAVIEQLGLPGPHVLHNGAQVHADGRTIASWPLPARDATALRDICTALELYAEFYVGEGYVVTDRRPGVRAHWRLLTREPDGLVTDVDLDRVEVVKATVLVFPDDDEQALLDRVAAAGLTSGPAHAPALPEVTFCNVTSAGADKGRALEAASRHLGRDLDAVVAVGDGYNDLSMFAVAGTAIAMGQAPAAVQAAAHLVVPDVHADGVARALDWAVAGAA